MLYNIETPRLLLRDILPGDDAGMFELDSDPEVHRYVGRKPVKTIEESRAVIDIIREQYTTHGVGRCAVIEKASGDFIGWTGLKYVTFEVNGHTHFYDVGYRLIKRYWGKGYGTEAAMASVQFAWDVLHATKVNAFADAQNIASRHVLEKTGLIPANTFLYEGDEHIWYEMLRP